MAAIFAAVSIVGPAGNRFSQPQQVTLDFPLCASPGYSANCVVDGDTIRIGERRIRLTGFDAPEIDGACQRESDLALAARDALHNWLAFGSFELDGGTQPPRDQYGRELRSARRGDDYLADMMLERGLARDNGWGAGEADWC